MKNKGNTIKNSYKSVKSNRNLSSLIMMQITNVHIGLKLQMENVNNLRKKYVNQLFIKKENLKNLLMKQFQGLKKQTTLTTENHT